MLEFSTHWDKHKNYLIRVENEPQLFRNFVKRFFEPWSRTTSRSNIQGQIVVRFKQNKRAKPSIRKGFFSYSRICQNNNTKTEIMNVTFLRSIMREVYKLINPGISVVGVWELFLLIIRTGIFEPLEYYLSREGFSLIHSGAATIKGQTILFAGKSGKSSFIAHVIDSVPCSEILSDNYVFVNGNLVLTLPELLRFGQPKRFRMSIYGRDCNSLINQIEGFADIIVFLELAERTECLEMGKVEAENFLTTLYLEKKEGIHFLPKVDPISLALSSYTPRVNANKIYKLRVRYGIENIGPAFEKLREEICG